MWQIAGIGLAPVNWLRSVPEVTFGACLGFPAQMDEQTQVVPVDAVRPGDGVAPVDEHADYSWLPLHISSQLPGRTRYPEAT